MKGSEGTALLPPEEDGDGGGEGEEGSKPKNLAMSELESKGLLELSELWAAEFELGLGLG